MVVIDNDFLLVVDQVMYDISKIEIFIYCYINHTIYLLLYVTSVISAYLCILLLYFMFIIIYISTIYLFLYVITVISAYLYILLLYFMFIIVQIYTINLFLYVTEDISAYLYIYFYIYLYITTAIRCTVVLERTVSLGIIWGTELYLSDHHSTLSY